MLYILTASVAVAFVRLPSINKEVYFPKEAGDESTLSTHKPDSSPGSWSPDFLREDDVDALRSRYEGK